MMTSKLLAKQLHQVYFGGNWTASNFKDSLQDITVEMANEKVAELNTILALTFHIHYYVKGTAEVFKGGELTIRDKFSFDHPTIKNNEEWQEFQNIMWDEVKEFISLIEQLDDNKLNDFMAEEKYGTYFKNITGIIEHTHYHLGQINVIKKIIISHKEIS
ncbi:DUF1572 domain-containing protein [Winogradskyella sp. SYSU M77433]|uniref:DUF1572 domain-containing protein n=1 Tax=Winogradskyella sp. SYSU M77433 TaxID=3042722 RepID=UPI002480809A|nr:DUF1572 domain-containing protein [Winogradskyella sp. SYSU M77433]MDH7914387.1 DUF1572 domain-containing protein [Winogradskyella sp. SYSU M77433]